jgi:hypothetical protein
VFERKERWCVRNGEDLRGRRNPKIDEEGGERRNLF